MIPFSKWIENNTALSEPQHKSGEKDMDMDKVVEKRMMQLVMDLETEGKGSRQDILKSIERVLSTVPQTKPQQQPQGQEPQGQQPQNQPIDNPAANLIK